MPTGIIPCRMQKTHRARRPRGRQLLSAAPTAILQPLRSCVPPFFYRTASPVRALWQCTFCKNVLRRQLHFRQQRLESDCQPQCTADGEKSINSYAARPHFKPLKRALGHACTLCQLCLRQVPAEPNLRESSARLAQRLIYSHRHIIFHNSPFLASCRHFMRSVRQIGHIKPYFPAQCKRNHCGKSLRSSL